MGNEVAFPATIEYGANRCAFETVESLASIAAMIQHITANRIEQVALVAISLSFDNEEKSQVDRQARIHASILYLLNSLRPLVRKTDVVFLYGCAMYFLLLGANQQGGEIVQSRLWEALLWRTHNIPERELLRPHGMTIGHSAYPAPYTHIDEFLEAASNPKLQFNTQPEKPTRKSPARQLQPPQAEVADDDFSVLARKIGIPYLSFLPRKLPECVQQLVNPQLAQELRCYPLGRERNTLTVAMLNPQDRSALDRLQQETGLLIFPVLTHPQALQTALEQLV
jgi:Type II secretion system (T2SS), protein E, N-terminal domain